MSKKSNPTVIGGFVVGAILLLAVGVALFGGAEFFAKRRVFVAYFDEDTKGLRVGSNVMMNGVRIGYVSDIALLVDDDTYTTETRVTMETLPEAFVRVRNGQAIAEGMHVTDADHDELVNTAGLRAVLEIESLITGQLQIAFKLRPDVEPRMSGVASPYQEIPTMPSSVQQFLANLREWTTELQGSVDISELGERITSIVIGLDELVHSPDVQEALSGINALVNDEDTQELSAAFRSLADELQLASGEAASFFRTADGTVNALDGDLQPIMQRLAGALSQAEDTLAAARVQLRGDTQQMHQFNRTLREVEQAAASMNSFFDYLERNPESILQGKRP